MVWHAKGWTTTGAVKSLDSLSAGCLGNAGSRAFSFLSTIYEQSLKVGGITTTPWKTDHMEHRQSRLVNRCKGLRDVKIASFVHALYGRLHRVCHIQCMRPEVAEKSLSTCSRKLASEHVPEAWQGTHSLLVSCGSDEIVRESVIVARTGED